VKERSVLAFAGVVHTIAHPVAETGRVGAWVLDSGRTGDLRVSVIAALDDTPARPPQADEIFIRFGAPSWGPQHAGDSASFERNGRQAFEARTSSSIFRTRLKGLILP
jgi:hypothetical protein